MTEPGSGGKSDKRTCTQCRKSKVKCDRAHPCSRCLRLGLSCVEQVRGRGRPLVSYVVRPGEREDSGGPPPSKASAAPPSVENPQSNWYNSSPPFSNFEDSLPAIQEFFADRERLGRINRKKLLIVLRSWGLIAQHKKSQSFFKTVQVVAHIFGLEIKDILNMEPEVYRELCEGGERQELVFRPEELPGFIKALDCEVCAVSKRIVINGESRFFNNDLFASIFLSSEDADRTPERATGYDVWMSCIDEEDRKDFFESCLSTALVSPSLTSETSKVFKCKDGHGRSFIANIRLRSIFLNAGDYVGYSFFVDPIPPCKYLTTSSRYPLPEYLDHNNVAPPPPPHMPPPGGDHPRGLRNPPALGPPPPPPGMPPMPRGGMMGDPGAYLPPPGYPYPYGGPRGYDYPPPGGPDHYVNEEGGGGGRWPPSGGNHSHKRKMGRGMDDEEDSSEKERTVAATLQRLYQPQFPSQAMYGPGAMDGGPPGRGGQGSGPPPYMNDPYYGDASGHLAMMAAVAAQHQAAGGGGGGLSSASAHSGNGGGGGGGGGGEPSPVPKTLRI